MIRQRAWRQPTSIRPATVGLLLILLVLGITYRQWRPLVGGFLIVADPIRPADALVPLAGDRSRVVDAAALFNEGHARWFVITDMWIDAANPPFTYANAVALQARQRGVPESRIVVASGLPRSTYQEGLDLRRLAQQQGWRSLIILTSSYHTRRSRIILQDVFRDTGIVIAVRPTRDDWYQATSWWSSSAGRRATISEYGKLLLYGIGYR